MKQTIVIILLFSNWLVGHATNFYVDDKNGNDANNGRFAQAAWQTLRRVNTATLASGDSVLFVRNGIWRGQLFPKSGSSAGNVTYAAYGTGAKPTLYGSANLANPKAWIDEGQNIWRTVQASPVDVGNLIFNNDAVCGTKKWTASQLIRQGDFWWDKKGSKTLELYSIINPALFYTNIEAALGKFMVYMQADSFVAIKNMTFKYGAADGIEIRNTHHAEILDCDLSFIGGTELTTKVRYGGGIQFWANSHDNRVERCKIYEIYDDAVTNQGNVSAGGTVRQYNLFYTNNLIWNCSESSFCFYIQPAIVSGSFMKNIHFENNTCVNAGGGWAANQRPDLKGFQVYCSENTALTDSVFITNNIFYNARCILFVDNSAVQTMLFSKMDYNCWFMQSASDTIAAFWTKNALKVWTVNQFASYQTNNHADLHSFMADPLFENACNNNYHLAANSPCIKMGVNTGIDSDFDLNPRPKTGVYTIGAYGYLH